MISTRSLDSIRSVYWNDRSGRFRTPFRLGGAVLVLVALALPISPALRALPDLPTVYEGLVGTGMQAAAATAAVVVAVTYLDRRSLADIGLDVSSRSGRDVVVGLLTGTGLVAVGVLAGVAAGWVEFDGTLGTTSTVGVVPGVLAYALLMAMIGFHEELFLRGYLLTNIYEGLQIVGHRIALGAATVVSSSVFAVLHLLNPNASVISTLGLFALGLFFATGYVFTENLAFPVGAHAAWNFVMGVGFGLPVSGRETTVFVIDIVERGPDLFTGGEFGPEAGLLGILALLVGIVCTYVWATSIRSPAGSANHLATDRHDVATAESASNR